MLRILRVSTLAAVALLAAPALAKTFPIPTENPIATVSLPDKWTLNPYEGGVEGTSPDGGVYIAVEQVAAADVKSAVTDGIDFYAKQGVTIDPDLIKSSDTKINDLSAYDLQMTGKDKNGPTTVGMTLVQTNAEGKFLLLYYWGSDEAAQKNMSDIQAIGKSVQATK